MKGVVHKYVLTFSIPIDYFEITGFVKVLSVGWQHGNIVMWVLKNDKPKVTKLEVLAMGTGWEQTDDSPEQNVFNKFIGTVMCDSLVFHVFYKIVK